MLVAAVLVFAGGLGEQQVGDLVEQDQRVVGRVELQLPHRRQQRRGPPLRAQTTERLRFRAQAVSRESAQPARRNIDGQVPNADRADSRQTLEGLGDLIRGQLPRARAKIFPTRKLIALGNVQQLLKGRAVVCRGGFEERSVKPGGGTIARGGDRPDQHGRSGQQHLALDQTSGREIEQHTRALRGRPRPRVKPPQQISPRRSVGEVAVPVLALDLPSVLAVRRIPAAILSQTARVLDGELLGDPAGDDLRHLGGSGEERAEEPHRAQLDGEPEPVVIAAASRDQRPVSLIEVKEPLKLRCGRRFAVAAVARQLAGAQEINRHGPASPRACRAQSRLRVSIDRRTSVCRDRRFTARREMTVEARAWDAGLLDDLRDRAPRLTQMRCPFQFPWVDQHRSADPTALRSRDGPRVRRALHRVRPLHLTEQRQEHDRELRHRILRVARVDLDRVSQVPDTNLALGQLVNQVQGVPDRPTEPVERVHDDHVARPRARTR